MSNQDAYDKAIEATRHSAVCVSKDGTAKLRGLPQGLAIFPDHSCGRVRMVGHLDGKPIDVYLSPSDAENIAKYLQFTAFITTER